MPSLHDGYAIAVRKRHVRSLRTDSRTSANDQSRRVSKSDARRVSGAVHVLSVGYIAHPVSRLPALQTPRRAPNRPQDQELGGTIAVPESLSRPLPYMVNIVAQTSHCQVGAKHSRADTGGFAVYCCAFRIPSHGVSQMPISGRRMQLADGTSERSLSSTGGRHCDGGQVPHLIGDLTQTRAAGHRTGM